MKHKLNWFGKTLEVTGKIILNNEEQFNEDNYDAVLLLVGDSDEQVLRILHDIKVLVVKESEIKKAVWMKELGYL